MTILITISIAIAALALATVALNAVAGPMLMRRPGGDVPAPRVSILIPARDEARNIPALLDGLCRQDYPDLEILILDDHSRDGTGEAVAAVAASDSRVRLLQGGPLPPGWTGKNWACQQLAEAARGDMLIFTDADNRHAPHAVSNTVAWMQRHRLGFLSAFPQQETGTLAERLAVPAVDLFVYAALPLWSTLLVPSPLFAAANGQWIAMTREAWMRIGGHQSVRGKVVEDVELSRRAKRLGIRTLLTAGTGAVYCRMYRNAGEVWDGFTKNLFGITGNRPLAFWLVMAAMAVAFILPYPALLVPGLAVPAGIAVALNLAMRAVLAIRFRHPLWVSVLLHPVGIGYIMVIAINSYIQTRRGRVRWKGREIAV